MAPHGTQTQQDNVETFFLRKFRNKKVTFDGILFDSMLERDYYIELQRQQKLGIITEFSVQPPFLLIPSFKKDGKTFRKTTYTADFSVLYPDGTTHIIDTKGFQTDTFRLKRKILEYNNPEIRFYIVERKNGEWKKKR